MGNTCIARLARIGLLCGIALLTVVMATSASRAADPAPAPVRHADGAVVAPLNASPTIAPHASEASSTPTATPTAQPTIPPTPRSTAMPRTTPAPTVGALPETPTSTATTVAAAPHVAAPQPHPKIPTRPPGTVIPVTPNPTPGRRPDGTVYPVPSVAPITRTDVARGVEYTSWWNGEYASTESDLTLAQTIVPLGANWIAPIVTCYQTTITATAIDCSGQQTPTDSDLQHLIAQAHSLGLKVMLKPMLDLSNDPDHWRGEISMGSNQSVWNVWFTSYTTFITHYAALAQSTGADMFSIGCELDSTNDPSIHNNTAAWRMVVAAVRAAYRGSITYAANPGEEVNIAWWDAVDTIGVDAYYGLTDHADPTIAQLEAAWQSYAVPTLSGLASQFNKPVIFTEVGYQSQQGANVTPWGTTSGVLDLQEQANCYTALMEVFRNYSWWRGVFWWSVLPYRNQGGSANMDFTPINKPAQVVVSAYYGGVHVPAAIPTRHPDGTLMP